MRSRHRDWPFTSSPYTYSLSLSLLLKDLLVEVAKLAESGRFDHLLIESTGISEPLPVAETFTFDLDDESFNPSAAAASGSGAAVSGAASGAVVPRPLMGVARLASMVTVVDGVNFLKDLCERGDLTLDEIGAGLGSFAMQQHGDDPKGAQGTQGAEEGEGDERPLANLLMEQVTRGAALSRSLACRQAQPLPATHASSFLSFFLFFF